LNLLSENIAFLRKNDGISQQELARIIGVNRGNIDSYERGASPKPEILVKIANYFSIHLEVLITKNITKSNYNLLVRERLESNYEGDLDFENEMLSTAKFRKSLFLELMLKIKYEDDLETRAKLIEKALIQVSLLEDENTLLTDQVYKLQSPPKNSEK
jgi:transcriptional regulator with XRE-family HTH domain